MTRTALALATLMALASGPALAQGADCPGITIYAASASTERVPRMGPGSDLLTQSAGFQNTSQREITFSITLSHRAVQQSFVAGQSFRLAPGGTMTIALANVLKPGIGLAELRSTVRIACP